ncbi:hypothetical protein [Micromonospora sp. HM5-17]|jgi:hypothetical protein|uniref:hypothetical protein n=1 Tax=Micromonospora sp. HM5-17 TaxID=2487710 RepID=UPI000F494FAC|nr:hypothetical protein [Micromonospora sp. HM5-17]ROT32157.1 hypothetical protein EF879_11145 [Micromonospora sp. HM5-17]
MPQPLEVLARRYRRLLLCYPRQYRRARGEEIVATFLDLAPPDRTRPTVREAVNLIRHGLRCRLGRPNSRGVVLGAVLTALAWGLFTGAFAARLGWETARPLPTEAEATELFGRMLGRDVTGQVVVDPALFVIYGQPLNAQNLHLLFSPDAGEYQQGRAAVSLHGPSDVDHRALVDSTRAWLYAHGWRVSEVVIRNRVACTGCDESTLPKEAVFAARRGDDVVSLEISLGDPRPRPPKPGVDGYDETYASVELTRASPAAVWPLGVVGGLTGALVGWLTFGWASRRTEGRGRLLRGSTTVLFGIAVAIWYVPLVVIVPSMLVDQLETSAPSWPPMWEWLGQPALLPVSVVGTGAALVALAVSALPRRRELATDARPAV